VRLYRHTEPRIADRLCVLDVTPRDSTPASRGPWSTATRSAGPVRPPEMNRPLGRVHRRGGRSVFSLKLSAQVPVTPLQTPGTPSFHPQ
jgi:hypothetical protein